MFRGEISVQAPGALYPSVTKDGWNMLAAFDANKDGRIDPADPAWKALVLFIDANANGVIDPNETSMTQDGGGWSEYGGSNLPRVGQEVLVDMQQPMGVPVQQGGYPGYMDDPTRDGYDNTLVTRTFTRKNGATGNISMVKFMDYTDD